MSDYGVNLKILLEPAVSRGDSTFDARNHALAACANEVADRVIADNRDQVRRRSASNSFESRTHLNDFRDHLQALDILRNLAGMPPAIPPREALHQRHARYPGLTRPELALATAYTKIDLIQRIEATVLVDDSYLVGRFLQPYFPEFARRARRGLRPIVCATTDRTPPSTSWSISSDLLLSSSKVRGRGVAAEDVMRAWVIATDVLSIHQRAGELKHKTATIAAESELGAFLALERACRLATGWALSELEPATSIGAAATRFKPAFESLSGEFETMLAGAEHDRFERLYRELRNDVLEGELAHGLARLAFADHILSVLSEFLAPN